MPNASRVDQPMTVAFRLALDVNAHGPLNSILSAIAEIVLTPLFKTFEIREGQFLFCVRNEFDGAHNENALPITRVNARSKNSSQIVNSVTEAMAT